MKHGITLLKSSILLLLCLIATTSFGQTNFNESIQLYDRDVALNMQPTLFSDGHITTGYTQDLGGQTRVNLVKSDATGNVVWSNVYQLGAFDRGNAVEQTSDGGYAVTGSAATGSVFGFAETFLLKTDPAGNVMWAQNYPHITSAGLITNSEGMSLEQLPGDEYIIAGSVNNSFGSGLDLDVIHTDPGGNTIGQISIDLGGNEMITSIKPLSGFGGGYAFCGHISYAGAIGRDVVIGVLDPALNPIWINIYRAAGDDAANSLEVRPSGEILVVGESNSFTNGRYDALMLQVDPFGGGIVWTNIYGHKRDDFGMSVEQLSSGRLALTGRTNSAPASTQVALITMTDGAGNYLFNKVFGDLANAQSGNSIKEDPFTGDIVIAGVWEDVPGSAIDQEIYMVRTDAGVNNSCAYNRPFFSVPVSFLVGPVPFSIYQSPFHNPIPAAAIPVANVVTDRCCACSDVIADFTYSPIAFCAGDPVTFTNNSTCAATYKWFVNGVLVSTATDIVYTFSAPGVYTVELRAKLPGCPAASKVVTINVTCRMGVLESDEIFNTYPNPTADFLNVEAMLVGFEGEANFELIDMTGRVMFSEQLTVSHGFTERLDLTELPEGIYQLSLQYGEENILRSISVVR